MVKVTVDVIKEKLLNFQKSHHVNGSIVVAYGKNVIYSDGFGFSDKTNSQVCRSDTQFCIASITKQFTAAAVLRALYDQHYSFELLQNDLQKPISNYLCKNDKLWDSAMPEWADKINLHQLLSHTSGIFSPSSSGIKHTITSISEIANLFKNVALNFEPGAKYQYCNSGYFLLSEIVQRITQKNLSNYMKDRFFDPLGMKNTFMPDSGNVKLWKEFGCFPKLARGYFCEINSGCHMVETENYKDSFLMNGAGAMISTSEDLITWNYNLHNNLVLENEVTELMLSEHIQMNTQNKDRYYGYGIIKEKRLNGDIYTHDGGFAGFMSTSAYRVCDQLSYVALSNINVYTNQFDEVINRESKAFNHQGNQGELWRNIDMAIEKEFPGFLELRKKHELIHFEDIFLNTSKQSHILGL